MQMKAFEPLGIEFARPEPAEKLTTRFPVC
jgi:hypothetical protein